MDFRALQLALVLLTNSLTSTQATLATIAPQQEVIERPLTQEEQLVRITFWDAPDMFETIRCESHFRQFDAKGKTLKNWNTNGTVDRGIGQINSVHEKEAKRLGFDLDTLEGNLSFARHLYDREGSSPWVCSRIKHAGDEGVQTLAFRKY